jgi:LacI family transcriptional regulator
MTVSKALRDKPDVSEKTRATIRALALQMGYVPDSSAQNLRTRRSKILGLVLSSLTNPLFARVVMAVEARAHELGYDLMLAHTLNNVEREETSIRRLMARRVDGLLISPVYRIGSEAPVYQELLSRKIPTVILGHLAPFCQNFVNVESDDLLGGYAVTDHLLKLGHRRIAFFAGPPATPWTRERFEGYRRALSERGMDVDDKLIFQAGRTVEDGSNAALQLINESTDVTAIQAINDLVAAGCAQELMRQGFSIPGDLSVAGFGNVLLGEHFRVPLTTVRQPKFRLGAAAMDVLTKLLRSERVESKRLPAELVVRSSTGTPPASSKLARPR